MLQVFCFDQGCGNRAIWQCNPIRSIGCGYFRAVGGVIMMLKGANAHEVIDNVELRMKSIQKSLPEGVRIEPYLNRSDLVGRAIGTVSTNLIEGALIVIFILVLLLGNFGRG